MKALQVQLSVKLIIFSKDANFRLIWILNNTFVPSSYIIIFRLSFLLYFCTRFFFLIKSSLDDLQISLSAAFKRKEFFRWFITNTKKNSKKIFFTSPVFFCCFYYCAVIYYFFVILFFFCFFDFVLFYAVLVLLIYRYTPGSI